MKNANTHIDNAWAKLVRTPRFKMQIVTDRVKQERKTACRKPVTTAEPWGGF